MADAKPPFIYPQKPRAEVGPRELNRTTHYDSCDGTTCPCYEEGKFELQNKVLILESALLAIYNMDHTREGYKMHKQAKQFVDP